MNDSLNQDVQRPFFDTNVYTGFDVINTFIGTKSVAI